MKPFPVEELRARAGNLITVKQANDRIHRLNQELAAGNNDLETFSYSVSHDLRAPLRAVNALANILMEEYSAHLAPDAQAVLKNITKSAKRMQQLIDDLLRFSHLTRQRLSKHVVRVADLVPEVLEELRVEHAGRNIQVQLGDLHDCLGDPALLKQVFTNLLSNAVKFTRPRPHARIEIGSKSQNGETVFFVRDNGAGFDMTYAQNLFGVFQRFHRPEEFEGTGVGLSIVHRIIQAHGGRIWAESAVDKGATFYFTLSAQT